MYYSPIVIFVYNRPWHTQKTVESLQKNNLASKSKLFIFSDGPENAEDKKSVDDVRNYISGIKGFIKINIFKSKVHLGLADSVIKGVNRVFEDYDRIIVLEDDLVTSSYFLDYMNEALEKYKKEEKVMQISGYMFPIKTDGYNSVLLPFTTSWGWATWKNRWKYFISDSLYLLNNIKKKHLETKFNLNNSYPYVNMLKDQINGKIDSWAIRWYASVFLQKGLTLYPSKTLVYNIGMDGSGTHQNFRNKFNSRLLNFNNGIYLLSNNINFNVFNKVIEYLKEHK